MYETIPTSLGVIRSKRGLVYQISPEDVLWLARVIQEEGGNKTATAWTYAQRMALYPGRSLTGMLLAHSQPVNPAWRRGGTYCGPGGRYENDERYCSERSMNARATNAVRPWSAISPEARQVAVDFATAKLPNPVPKATDFADAAVSTGFLQRNPGSSVVLKEGNWYIAEPGSVDWPSQFVTLSHEGRVQTDASSGIMPLVVGALAMAAFIAWRTRSLRAGAISLLLPGV